MDPLIERQKSILYLILAATLWSTGGLLIKLTSWQPLGILVGRNVFSSAVLLLYLRRFPTHWTRWKVLAAVSHILTAFQVAVDERPDQCLLEAESVLGTLTSIPLSEATPIATP